MVKIFWIVLFCVFLIILFCAVIGIHAANKDSPKYFSSFKKQIRKYPEVLFYIKKHTLYRLFMLEYAIVHSVLNILSVVSTLITVYMVIDSSIKTSTQIFFLLVSAVSSNLTLGLRLDKAAECYGYAMRVMEEAILKFFSQKTPDFSLLSEADIIAERYIGDRYL